MKKLWNDTDGENSRYSEKACHSATWTTTNHTWTTLGWNQGRLGDRLTICHLKSKINQNLFKN